MAFKKLIKFKLLATLGAV